MEEENKSLRFAGLANTPLANASLEGRLYSRRSQLKVEGQEIWPNNVYVRKTYLLNRRRIFIKPEKYICRIREIYSQNQIDIFIESEKDIYRIREIYL